MFRYRSTRKRYKSEPKDVCPFCVPTEGALVKEYKHTRIIRNIYAYDLWEFRDVTEHLLIVPKRHVKNLKQLTKPERDEVLKLIMDFEAKNYNIYARSSESVKKTIPAHQHTHAIKTDDKQPKMALFINKPYFLIKR